MTVTRLALNLLKAALVLIIFYFLGRQVLEHWDQIRSHPWEINIGLMALSVALAVATFLILAQVWRTTINSFGHSIRLWMAFKIMFVSNLGRYVPGRIWQVAGMLYWAGREGVTPEEATASFVLSQLFAIPASLLVYFATSIVEPGISIDRLAIVGPHTAYVFAGAMIVICLAVVIFMDRLVTAVNRILARLHRPVIALRLDKLVALKIFTGYVVAWLVYGLAFWVFLLSVQTDAPIGWIAAVGVFNAAYQIGYLTLFAPGGLGPRELVIGVLLGPLVGPIAPALAILSRIWTTVIDAAGALIGLLVRK
ncbi:MAG: flippase-like domain-containing protein [candidate division Zixibacteria bacterium]|nr:flippase-like domain-containing protein [candidate division Zixibacteria bacterium]